MSDGFPLSEPFGRGPLVQAGFFGRAGGVSKPPFDTLNCGPGSSDDTRSVTENRKRVAKWFGQRGGALMTLKQTHSAKAVIVDGPWTGDRPDGDALVTNERRLPLGVLTADCAPVLLVDPTAKVIGAAHAGWRGALSGVIESTVEAMGRLGAHAADIAAAIGPCIAQASYEVGPEFEEKFLEQDVENERFFKAGRGDRLLFDLAGYVDSRLYRAGVRTMARNTLDTFKDDALFSHRRALKEGRSDYGRQVAAIMLV